MAPPPCALRNVIRVADYRQRTSRLHSCHATNGQARLPKFLGGCSTTVRGLLLVCALIRSLTSEQDEHERQFPPLPCQLNGQALSNNPLRTA